MKLRSMALLALILAVAIAPMASAQKYQKGDDWISKWWGLDLVKDTGGFAVSAKTDWLSEGTGGALKQDALSTGKNLHFTKTSTVNLPKNGGNLEWQIVTLDVEDDKNMSTSLEGAGKDLSNIEWHGIIVIKDPKGRTTTMNPAHDDYAHIWLNGKKVYDNEKWTGAATKVTHPTKVTLNKGENVLVYRCGESGGADYVNLKFSPTDGDLQIAPTTDGKFFEVITAVDPKDKTAVTWANIKASR